MSNVMPQLDAIQSSYIGSYNGAMHAVQNENVTGSIEGVKSDISSLHKKTDELTLEIKRISNLIDHSSACPSNNSLYHSMGKLEEGISALKTDIAGLKTSIPKIEQQIQDVLSDNKWYRRIIVFIPTMLGGAVWAIVSNWDSIKSFLSSIFS